MNSDSEERNARGWDVLAPRYQSERGWPCDDLCWGHRVPKERELRALGDVAGKRTLVLGCGGGQDLVAMAGLGATGLVGVDLSTAQLEHARTLLDERRVVARLERRSVADLSIFADESFDLVVSVHALSYVEHAEACFREARRVLRPGGVLGIGVHHPIDASTGGEPPYGFTKPYFQVETDWAWRSLGGEAAPFRSYHRTVADWFTLVSEAGLSVEKLLEPRPSEDIVWEGADYKEKLAWVPGTLIVVARRAML